MTMPVRVVIADDHPMVRQGLRAVLDQHPDLEVVAGVGDGEAAVTAADNLRPDVVLMDINMPVLDGIEATRRIKARHPNVAVLMLTMFEDDDSVLFALRAGASGYLLRVRNETRSSAPRSPWPTAPPPSAPPSQCACCSSSPTRPLRQHRRFPISLIGSARSSTAWLAATRTA